MYRIFIGILIISIFSSCEKKSELQKEFVCETTHFSNTEIVTDFQNKFSLTIPKHWKTQLYFNNLQTQIFTADTIKKFTDTYTINVEYNSGNLQINDDFKSKIKTELTNAQLQLLKNKIDVFKEKPSIWFVSKGTKQNFDYYYFELFVKQNKSNYFKIAAEIYGNQNIDQRFCESISIIETLKYLD